MAYNIVHIDRVTKLGPAYFFDANLWLKILKPPINLSPRDIKYLEFVERFKNDPGQPKIIITAFLLSEVINRYLHDVYVKIANEILNIIGYLFFCFCRTDCPTTSFSFAECQS